jgi:CubicO group peptidase (beta-lactamase class C family)
MISRRQLLTSSLLASPALLFETTPLRSLGADPAANFTSVKSTIKTAIEQGKTTGVALAVVHRGQIVWEEGFGHADSERGIVSTAHTPYCLASITKTFTATLVAALAQEKHVSLDDAAMPYLKTSPLQGPNGDPNAVTIRMLGSHCSGLPLTFAAHFLEGPAPAQSAPAFLNDYGHLAYPPGQVYEYGNIGFEALGAIVEAVTHQAFSIAMEERVLQPLALRDSFFSEPERRPSAVAAGYSEEGKRIPLYRTSTPPSGELYASAHDLAKFALFHLRGYLRKSTSLSRAVLETRTPVFRGPHGIDTMFGWFTGKLSTGEPYFFKAGGQPGVAAKMFFLPSADVACIVLTNRTDNMPLVDACCEQVLRHYVPDFVIPEENAGAVASPFVAPPSVTGDWEGRLVNGGADQIVRFRMRADGTATFALSDRSPETVTNIQAQPPGFGGITSGLIDCEHAADFGVRRLELKLIPHNGKLIGRVIAHGARPGVLAANIPYVITLDRV